MKIGEGAKPTELVVLEILTESDDEYYNINELYNIALQRYPKLRVAREALQARAAVLSERGQIGLLSVSKNIYYYGSVKAIKKLKKVWRI